MARSEDWVIKINGSKASDGVTPWESPAYVTKFDPHAATDKVTWTPDRVKAHVFRDRAMAEAVVAILLEEHLDAEIVGLDSPC